MVRKKAEGDEDERRAAARDAERAGERPSARGDTTGASKQRRHMGSRSTTTHDEKLRGQHQGKQSWRTGNLAEEGLVDTAATEPARSYEGRGSPAYGDRHERVFRALTTAEQANEGEPVPLRDVARAADLSEDEIRPLLHDLVTVHRLATEIQTDTAGDLYGTAARL